MPPLLASNVLVSGLQGLGAEVAKNLVLAGVESITLHDEGLVELWDLSGSFLFSEDDVGKKRALVSFQKLIELNNSVAFYILTTDLTKENLSQFQVVVFTDISLEKAIEFDRYCHLHEPPIAFIKTEVRGLFGSVFCDLGPKFTVVDVDGEEPYTGNIVSISNDDPALIECVDCERLDFQDGDLIVFSDVKGMTNLNGETPRKIKNARPYSFTLDEDTTSYGAYEGGGIVTQVKQPKQLHFKPLSEAIKNPSNALLNDFSKADRPPLLHLAFQALDKFRTELGRFPVAGFEDDAQKLISIFTSINDSCVDGKIEEVNQKLLRYFAFGAKAVLNPMATMFGGIVAQEVVKACSGKFHPLFQFMYFDSLESLPTNPPSPDEVRPKNSRYDAQISVFGSKLQKKLEMAQVFIVGAGALGCEFLKNVALMGVSCGDNGKITITDDDVIERCNLTTQLLFHKSDIQKPKSTVAAAAAQAINKHIHIKALQSRVSHETKDAFDDSFWEKLNVVITAVDNVVARLYIDERCSYFQKPLLDCGTLGAKFNTQMIIPNLSENYRASHDPPEKKPSLSTVYAFPYNIDHCLTWARDEFHELLENTPSQVNAYLENPDKYTSSMLKAADAQARDTLECVVECLVTEKCETFEDCIKWARLKFEHYFVNDINELILDVPKLETTRSGALLWTPPKRFPSPLQFCVDDPIHLTFVKAAAMLRAKTFGISKPVPDWMKSQQELGDVVNKVTVPNFVPKKDGLIVTRIQELIGRLARCKGLQLPVHLKMNPLQFDTTDGDDNYHMEMITGLAILRGRNYDIPQIEKLKAKFNAGLTRPAMKPTATATGLVCLELYKAMDGGHKLEDYRNTFANLGLPLLLMVEPVPPKLIHHGGTSWTTWDRWILKDNPSLENLLDFLQMKGINLVRNIVYDDFHWLYFCLVPGHRDSEIMDKKLVDLVREVTHEELPSDRNYFDLRVICDHIKVPPVSVYFSQ